MRKSIIGITMGDPAGIGPEVVVQAIFHHKIRSNIQPILIGNKKAFEQAIKEKGLKTELTEVKCPPAGSFSGNKIPIIESDTLRGITKRGRWTKQTGTASLAAVERGIALALDKKIQALVTAPICKEAWHEIGVSYAGHTELLAKCCKIKDYSMMFTGGPFRLVLLSIHKALKNVPKLVKKSLVIQTGITVEKTLKKYFGVSNPVIAVAGLNPHAGENGLLGHEEIKEIVPAIKQLNKRKRVKYLGPFPPDTLFIDALKGKYDMVMCMYHDQGLIPFKMLALHQGVNVTAGLPIIRTSPDHGTAFNLAGKGKADPGSMIAALWTAHEMIRHGKRNHKQ